MLALGPSGMAFETIPWNIGLARIGTSKPDWLFVGGVTKDRLAPIATALGVPKQAVEGLFQSSVPRFGRLERFSTLFVRYPLPILPGGRLRRTPVLLVGTADNVVVLSMESTDLEMRVEQRLAGLEKGMPRMLRATVALLGAIARANTDVVEQLEANLLALETQQAALKDETFLAQTFDLRSDILRIRSSLKHIRKVMRDLARGDLTLGTTEAGDRELFRLLEEDASDLYEGIEDLRESLQALSAGHEPDRRTMAGNAGAGIFRRGRGHGAQPLSVRDQGLAALTLFGPRVAPRTKERGYFELRVA